MLTEKRSTGWKALAVSATVAMVATVGGTMVVADSAFAKTDMDKLTLGGDAKVKYEVRTGATFGSSKSNLSAAASRIRINVGYDLTPDVSFFVQLQDARKWGSENCSFVGTTGVGAGAGLGGCNPGAIGTVATVGKANQYGTGVDLHQGYILVKNILHQGLSLKLGRQEIAFGDHRLFGTDTWSMVGNAFDAVRLTHSAPMADVDLFWARLSDNNGTTFGSGTGTGPESGVFFPEAGRFATQDQDLYGAYVTLKPAEKWTVEPYYFWLNDWRSSVGRAAITDPQAADQSRSTWGGRISGKTGGLDLTTEAAYQFGSIASGGLTGGKRERINAHAETAKIGYTFEPVPMKPRLGFEFNYASGDNDNNKATPAGAVNQHRGNFNTFENLFPTNHGRMGYMDLMAWKNMVSYAAVFDVKPSEKSKLEVKFSILRLANKQDNWYRGQQVIYATSCSTGVAACGGRANEAASLGQEMAVHYWVTLKERFKLEFGYGHFFAGEYLRKSRPQALSAGQARSTATFTENGDQDWGYVMAKVEF